MKHSFLLLACLVPMLVLGQQKRDLEANFTHIQLQMERQDLRSVLPLFQQAEENGLANYPELQVQYLYLLSEVYSQLAQADSAKTIAQNGLRIAKENGLQDLIAYYQYNKATFFAKRAMFPEAFAYLDSAEAYYRSADQADRLSGCLGKKANALAAMGQQEQAIEVANEALELLSLYEEPLRSTEVYNDLGGMYGFMNDLPNCARMLLKAHALAQEHRLLRRLAGTSNNLSVLFTFLQQFEQARKYNQEALHVCEILHLSSQKTATLFNRVNLSVKLEEIDSAQWYLQRLGEGEQNPSLLALKPYIQTTKGEIALKREQAQEAIAYFEEALTLAKTNQDPAAEIGASSGMAHALYQTQNHAKVLQIIDRLLPYPALTPIDKKALYDLQATIFREANQYQEALEAQEWSQQIQDTILSLERIGLAVSLEANYERKAQQSQIERLKIENQLVQEQNRQNRRAIVVLLLFFLLLLIIGYIFSRHRRLRLEKNLVEGKESLLRLQINPHFIFNSLNSIQSSFLQADEEKTIHLFSKFSHLMRKVLHNSEAAFVPLQEELDLLHNYLELEKIRSNHKFVYRVEVAEGINPSQVKIPSMILQIFIENAIWHGIGPSKEQGSIEIIVTNAQDRLRIQILDDGVGRAFSLARKSEDQKKRQSLGIQLTQERIQQLNRKYGKHLQLEIKDRLDTRGTSVELLI